MHPSFSQLFSCKWIKLLQIQIYFSHFQNTAKCLLSEYNGRIKMEERQHQFARTKATKIRFWTFEAAKRNVCDILLLSFIHSPIFFRKFSHSTDETHKYMHVYVWVVVSVDRQHRYRELLYFLVVICVALRYYFSFFLVGLRCGLRPNFIFACCVWRIFFFIIAISIFPYTIHQARTYTKKQAEQSKNREKVFVRT